MRARGALLGLLWIAIGVAASRENLAHAFGFPREEAPEWLAALLAMARVACVALGVAVAAAGARRGIYARGRTGLRAIGSLAFLCLLWSAGLPVVLPFLPAAFGRVVPVPFDLLSQGSKRPGLPEDYVAILGDSNAAGMGDWCLDGAAWRTGQCHSAHLIQQALGRDVISFGRAGRSNVGGFVREPLHALRVLRARYDVPDPSVALAYFYEGNDPIENLVEVGLLSDLLPRLESVSESEFHGFLEERVLGLGSEDRELDDSLIGRRDFRPDLPRAFPWYALGDALRRLRPRAREPADSAPAPAAPGRVNVARVADAEVALPSPLPGPSLELAEADIALALRILELSLRHLAAALPGARLVLVYIPSPLSTYALVGDASVALPEELSRYVPAGFPSAERLRAGDVRDLHPASSVAERSDRLYAGVEAICARNAIELLDARPELRRAARLELVHGPRDWRHLNRRGYEALAAAVVRVLREEPPPRI